MELVIVIQMLGTLAWAAAIFCIGELFTRGDEFQRFLSTQKADQEGQLFEFKDWMKKAGMAMKAAGIAAAVVGVLSTLMALS